MRTCFSGDVITACIISVMWLDACIWQQRWRMLTVSDAQNCPLNLILHKITACVLSVLSPCYGNSSFNSVQSVFNYSVIMQQSDGPRIWRYTPPCGIASFDDSCWQTRANLRARLLQWPFHSMLIYSCAALCRCMTKYVLHNCLNMLSCDA